MADANTRRSNFNESAMSAAEEELRRRRERGKESQARFRKRQAQASQETRAQNEKMRAAIAEVVRATRRSDRPGLLKAVCAAADIAGVDASGLREGDHDHDEEDDDIGERNEEVVSALVKDGASSSKSRTPMAPQKGSQSPAKETHANTCGGDISRFYSASTTSGRLSPRLDYGIWIDATRAMTVSKPPVEIMPFIGAGRYTFSGQLYWACTEYLISLCQAVTTPHLPSPWFACNPASRPSPRDAESRLWNVLQHRPPVPSVRLAQALAEAQRQFRDCGYMQADSPACNEQVGTLLREKVEAKCVERGQDLSVWMTISELERHVRGQLGSEAFKRLESVITACCITNDSQVVSGDVRNVVRLLVKNLAESYTCFGDGPRWRTDAVSALFNQKMRV
ncbi:hypothetical protein F5Y09DRAFT_279581 [Xylaria sp. FL1042]|nr:hypothetical protein F5Y09DRAFT_279581 [Xylaria sp. FL1042]